MKLRRNLPQYVFLVFIVVCCILFSFTIAHSKKCKHRKIPYSTSDYSEYKKEYAAFFDSIATNRFDKCICCKMPSLFNSKIKYDEYTSITIEPLFVNLQNCDGIYAQRVYGKYSALYSNGKIPHSLFVIKNNDFIKLNDLDSIQIKNVLTTLAVFTEIYTQAELDSIYEIVKYGTLWTYESEIAPYNVKDKGKVIYDAFNEKL